MNNFWSARETALLKSLWPKYTATQIAKLVGRSRNAVIGRANRLNLKFKGYQKIEIQTREKVLPKVSKVSKPIKQEHTFKPIGIHLFDMPAKGRCRYPISDKPPTCCGHPAVKDYCHHHLQIMRPKR